MLPSHPTSSPRSGSLPRISLVTPSFNQAAFLETTLRSVLDQGYPNLEYVVVDGSSTDGSRDILERYSDRLAWWVSEPDRGHAHAINKGFARTTGEIMGWINSDDILLPGSLALAAAAFETDSEVEWLTSTVTVLDPAGSIIDSWGHLRWTRSGFFHLSHRWIQQESTLWRRSLWERAGGHVDEELVACDFELWARFFRHARLFHTPGSIGAFRFQPAQKTRNVMDRYFAEARSVLDRELADPGRITLPDERAERCVEIRFNLQTWSFEKVEIGVPPPFVSGDLIALAGELGTVVSLRSLRLPPWPSEGPRGFASLFPRRMREGGEEQSFLWLGSGREQGLELVLESDSEQRIEIGLLARPGPSRSDPARTFVARLGTFGTLRDESRLPFDREAALRFEVALEPGLNHLHLAIEEAPDGTTSARGDARPLLAAIADLRIVPPGAADATTAGDSRPTANLGVRSLARRVADGLRQRLRR